MNMVHIPLLNMNWCLVPKVASSSISSAILPFLPQQNLTMQWTTVHDKVWQRAGHVELNDYLSSNKSSSFLVTRHPFTRIASAFRNKLENRTRSHDGDYFYQNYSKKIFKYRLKYLPSYACGTRSPPAMSQPAESKWLLGGPKMAHGVWKGVNTQFLGAPFSFS